VRPGLSGSVRWEAFGLVLAVVLLDAGFIAIYFLARLPRASSPIKVAFTIGWTLATLAVVIRGLSRIRAARVRRKSA
jgi:hypothetical protein